MRKFKQKKEFDQKVVHIARVARVVAGGKRFRFRATVAIGNRRGKVGIGLAKGTDVSQSIDKAVNEAKKKLIEVAIINGTIPHEITAKYSAARVFLKPASPGTGIIAGGSVRIVLELAGVKNILSKILGSQSKVNNAWATWTALNNLERPETVSERRNKSIIGVVKEKKRKVNPQAKGGKRKPAQNQNNPQQQPAKK